MEQGNVIVAMLGFVSTVVTGMSAAIVFLWKQNVEQIRQNTIILVQNASILAAEDKCKENLANIRAELEKERALRSEQHHENKEMLTNIADTVKKVDSVIVTKR